MSLFACVTSCSNSTIERATFPPYARLFPEKPPFRLCWNAHMMNTQVACLNTFLLYVIRSFGQMEFILLRLRLFGWLKTPSVSQVLFPIFATSVIPAKCLRQMKASVTHAGYRCRHLITKRLKNHKTYIDRGRSNFEALIVSTPLKGISILWLCYIFFTIESRSGVM